MKVKVQYFGQLGESVGKSAETMTLDEGASVGDVLSATLETYPEMKQMAITAARNNEMATPDTLLHDGDHVDLFPPFAGG